MVKSAVLILVYNVSLGNDSTDIVAHHVLLSKAVRKIMEYRDYTMKRFTH